MKIQDNINIVDTIKVAAKERRNIVQLARRLGRTVSQTSYLLGRIARRHPKFREQCEILNWPLNINVGHIFIGDKHESTGENKLILQIGDHVIVKYQFLKTCEIYLAIPHIERKYYIGFYNKENKFKLKDTVWLTETEVSQGKLAEAGRQNDCKVAKVSKKTRTTYKAGELAGNVSHRAVVGVNYNFK